MPHSPQLAALADEVDRLLVRPGCLAAARRLAAECLDDPEQSQIDALQLPADPDDPADWTEDSLLVRQGVNDPVPPTPGQMLLALAALHAVYCPSAEPVLAVSADVPLFGDDGSVSAEYTRYVRWRALRDRVRQLGDYAAPWFAVLLRRAEQLLPPAGGEGAAPLPEAKAPLLPEPAEQTTPVTRALALLLAADKDGRRWTVKDVAAAVGVDKSTLYRDEQFKALVKALRAKRGTPPPAGQKDADGTLEAWDDDE